MAVSIKLIENLKEFAVSERAISMSYDKNGNLIYKGFTISSRNPAHQGCYIREVFILRDGVLITTAKSIQHAKEIIKKGDGKDEMQKV